MSSAPRRSGRSRKSNTKYINDGWNKETLRLLRESSESSNPTSADSEEEQLVSDQEFGEQELQAASESPDHDEDNLSVVSRSSKSSQVVTPREEDGGMSLAGSEDEGGGGATAVKRVRWKQPDHLHSRGIATVDRTKAVKNGAWQAVFGPQIDDLKPMIDAKARWWYHNRDVTLPSWNTMDEARKKEWSRQQDHKSDETRNLSVLAGITNTQRTRYLTLEDANARQFLAQGPDHTIVLGPWTQQQAYDLPTVQTKDIASAWRMSDDPTSSYHSGWILNVGEKPQCMAWAPHQHQNQFLAVAHRSTPQQRAAVPQVDADTSPAFTPSARYPLSIQIWVFGQSGNDATKATMDSVTQPRIDQYLAWNFGDVKQMAWAPEPKGTVQDGYTSHLGLLTIITSDGCARIIDVPRSDPESQEPVCLEIVSAGLTFNPPPDGIFTCFAYASNTDLILGTSSGYIQIYNLMSKTSPPQPYYTHRVHHTYISALCMLADTPPTTQLTYPHFLASTSAAGTIQLTDLRCPAQDTLTIPRARIPNRNLICNPHTRTFITTIDSSGNTEAKGNAQTVLVGHNPRHFYTAMNLCKFPEGSGTATALAGSLLHPCILMGHSGGTIWAQNVVRRALPGGRSMENKEAGAWVQKLVEYDWIPDPDTTSTPSAPPIEIHHDNALYHGPPIRKGTSRLYQGFRPEKIDLSGAGSKKRKVTTNDEGNAVQVVFEEEQAVTCIEWNNNGLAGVAGWCAIAWGSGIVWVSDLGHDTP